MEKRKIRIGIVGPALSGKDAIAHYLSREHNFIVVDTGGLVREHISKHKLGEPTRTLMQDVANIIREKKGSDYFVRESIKSNDERIVLTGLRVKAEVEMLKQTGGIIIYSESSLKLRYERVKKRNRTSDLVTFEEFKTQDDVEFSNDEPHKQNISEVIKMADFVISNNGSLNELHVQVNEVVQTLLRDSL